MGGVFTLTLHPQLIGRPGRLAMLEDLVRHMKAAAGTWFAPMREVAEAARHGLRPEEETIRPASP
jgi:peptidoglycan-N-acetylglucosamine deacetylase